MARYNIGANTEHYNIPNNYFYISESAFENRTNLKTVTIPGGVTTIGMRAFLNCSSLEEITLPPRLTRIGSNAFRGCRSLKSITIPRSVTTIGVNAFSDCVSLEEIHFLGNTIDISIEAFSGCTSLKSITLPNSVTKLGSGAFLNCHSLEEVRLSGNITVISEKLFAGCTSLRSVTIPNSVTEICTGAFDSCEALEEAILSNRLVTIYDKAFYGCASLKNIILPNSLTDIGEAAFSCCRSLTEIRIPESVIRISKGAFSHCGELTSAVLPKAMEGSIAEYLFAMCSKLESITIPKNITYIKNSAFKGCSGLTAVNFPDSVKIIGAYAFADTRLEKVTLPPDLSEILPGAFAGCGTLTRLTIPQSVKRIDVNAFSGSGMPLNDDGLLIVDDCLIDADSSPEKIVIPEGVRLIGSVTFGKNVKRIYIPGTLKYTRSVFFENSDWYNNYPAEREFFVIGDDTLLKYVWHDKNVVVLDGIKRIAAAAFAEIPGASRELTAYERIEIPFSVCEMDDTALAGIDFNVISLFGMDFTAEELEIKVTAVQPNGTTLTGFSEHYFQQLAKISYAAELAHDFKLKFKVNKSLELAAAAVNYLNGLEGCGNAKEYLNNRLYSVTELLVRKDRPDMLMRIIESEDFAVNGKLVDNLIKAAENLQKAETAKLLREYKSRM